jgi:hypothetical protein
MPAPLTLPASDARELIGSPIGQEAFDGLTVVADERLGEGRWTEHRRMVIRDGEGSHYAAAYENGLSETQDTGPWEYDETVTFTPVVVRKRMVEVTEYVSEAPDA